MYRSILVPLDGSTFAEHALPFALAIARRSGARLLLATVSTPIAEAYVEGLYFSSLELDQEVTARHRAYLESTAHRLRQKTDLPITIAVHHGEVAVTLCDLLAQGEADLVVMATHGRGAFSRVWMGSVADEMLRHTNVPMLLVRPTAGSPDLEQEPNLGKMLLPLDGSELAEEIIEPAIALAAVVPHAEIVLVRAIDGLIPRETAPDAADKGETESHTLVRQLHAMQDRLHQQAERYLEGIAAKLRARGLTIQTQVVVEDHAAEAILREAEHQHAGVIALETHGRHGLARLIHGSVGDKVVRGAHVPVLVHRPQAN
jgi:nucleotide-binding universal stress UspA family protein